MLHGRAASVLRILGVAVLVAWVFEGWRHFHLVLDDAYIAFRYISNHRAGWGLTWNPPPFAPVEGYTSFLWVILLDGLWRLTGLEPPLLADPVSLLCGYGSLGLGAVAAWRLALPAEAERLRPALLVLVLVAVATNRTFLTWLSGGLETALFNLCFTAWILLGLTPRRGARGGAWLSLAAVATALTRPDGLLAVAATPLVVAAGRAGERRRIPSDLAPLLAIPAHLLWRRATYGQWLPNTWAAKSGEPWPEAGLRYAASFVVEYGVWVWALLALAALPALARSRPAPGVLVVLAVVFAHLGFYTFVIGGDHFEYRVYSHLPLLLALSGAWLAVHALRPPLAIAAFSAYIISSWPIAWTHEAVTRPLADAPPGPFDQHRLFVPIADHFPGPAGALVARWDGWQAWLIRHYVGIRFHEHKHLMTFAEAALPTRAEGQRLGWEQRVVAADRSIGYLGWVLPGVALIDLYGLNDRVIARTPAVRSGERMMAHDRQPPEGYEACFLPNLRIVDRRLIVLPREEALTDERIRSCEQRYWETVSGPKPGS